jgi:uncharacterized protein (TIGR02246 family)
MATACQHPARVHRSLTFGLTPIGESPRSGAQGQSIANTSTGLTMRIPHTHAAVLLAVATAATLASPAHAQAPLRASVASAPRVAAAYFPSRDVDALLSLAGAVDARWNARDAAGVASLYAAEATVRGLAREPLVGREAIRAQFADNFGRLAPDLRHRTEVASLQPISDDVVISEGRAYIERALPDGSREVVKTFEVTSVAVRRGTRWQLVNVRSQAIPVTRDRGA